MPLVRQILVRVIMGRKRQLFNTGTGNQYKRDGERERDQIKIQGN